MLIFFITFALKKKYINIHFSKYSYLIFSVSNQSSPSMMGIEKYKANPIKVQTINIIGPNACSVR